MLHVNSLKLHRDIGTSHISTGPKSGLVSARKSNVNVKSHLRSWTLETVFAKSFRFGLWWWLGVELLRILCNIKRSSQIVDFDGLEVSGYGGILEPEQTCNYLNPF